MTVLACKVKEGLALPEEAVRLLQVLVEELLRFRVLRDVQALGRYGARCEDVVAKADARWDVAGARAVRIQELEVEAPQVLEVELARGNADAREPRHQAIAELPESLQPIHVMLLREAPRPPEDDATTVSDGGRR